MARWRDDRGSASVEFVLCAAAVVLLFLLVIQVGVWYHSRAVAQTAARHGLDHVRTLNGSTDAGVAAANEFLDQAGGGLSSRDVSATRDIEESTVTVTGNVVSILPGVSFNVSVTVNAPTERIEP
ncbi:MAG TPA: TadE/TadG family type IV pilus assembly protein [Ilumatobacter sp.]|nr:TadE/TadG family type IV pilus assembly protein [Ilumatobacter sp.]